LVCTKLQRANFSEGAAVWLDAKGDTYVVYATEYRSASRNPWTTGPYVIHGTPMYYVAHPCGSRSLVVCFACLGPAGGGWCRSNIVEPSL